MNKDHKRIGIRSSIALCLSTIFNLLAVALIFPSCPNSDCSKYQL
uniref:Uncharacterized protein n=1 Tax=Rhizophora mucronata TaxID=61149 RepID=A0A2P2LLS2_RHIMU